MNVHVYIHVHITKIPVTDAISFLIGDRKSLRKGSAPSESSPNGLHIRGHDLRKYWCKLTGTHRHPPLRGLEFGWSVRNVTLCWDASVPRLASLF